MSNMSYRPITDTWVLVRPRTRYHGSYPLGFVERARALLGVTINDPVLHVCSGKLLDYPYLKRAVGPNDGTVDLDPTLDPDYVMDVRKLGVSKGDLFPHRFDARGAPRSVVARIVSGDNVEPFLWHAALVDRPYSVEDAEHYAPGGDVLPEPNDLLKRTLSVVRPGGRVGFLDYVFPRPPKKVGDDEIKLVACIGVVAGYANRMRCFSVFERVAVNTLHTLLTRVAKEESEKSEQSAAPAPTLCAHCLAASAGAPTDGLGHTCSLSHTRDAPLIEPTPTQTALVEQVIGDAEARKVRGDPSLDGF